MYLISSKVNNLFDFSLNWIILTVLFLAQVADFEPRGCFVAEHPVAGLAILSWPTLLISAVLDAFDRNTDCMPTPNRSPDKLTDLERGRRRLPVVLSRLEKFNLIK